MGGSHAGVGPGMKEILGVCGGGFLITNQLEEIVASEGRYPEGVSAANYPRAWKQGLTFEIRVDSNFPPPLRWMSERKGQVTEGIRAARPHHPFIT